VLDLGGSKCEQRKWLFFFENVYAVIFVVALNEYDLQLREEPSVNRMHESLHLFANLLNFNYFENIPIVLLLNKTDLFSEKIQRRPLSACFPEYSGGANYRAALQFIENKFTSMNTNTSRKIYSFPTCATSDMQHVFTDMMQNVLKN